MANTNLIIAIVFAALFGAAILWLAIYYLHRCIHRKCYDLGHWFHVLLSHVPESEDYSHERASNAISSSSKSRSTRRSRSNKTSSRSKKRHRSPRGSPRDRMRERAQGWSVGTEDKGPAPVVNYQRDEYHPKQFGWEFQEQASSEPSISDPGPAMMPEARRTAMPHMVPPLPLPMPTAASPQVAFEPPYVQPYVEEYEPEESRQDTQTVTTPPPDLMPGKADFIHICDEYPSMVLEALKQQALSSSYSDSVSSSDSSGSTQQIPRVYIPRSAPRAAFQFPQYPYLQTRLCNTTPTSYPRQWLDKFSRKEAAPPRYAPYTRASERRKLRDADWRRPAAISEIPKPPMGERWSGRRAASRRQTKRERPEPRSYGPRQQSSSLEYGRDEQVREEVQEPEFQRRVDDSGENEQDAAFHESDILERQLPPQDPASSGIFGGDAPAPVMLNWDPLMRRTPRPYSSSSGRGQEHPLDDAMPRLEVRGTVEEEPERRPIFLGIAPLDTEEETQAAKPEPEQEPALEASVPYLPQEQYPESPVSPSTFISSLHMSDSIRDGSQEAGGLSASEQRSGHRDKAGRNSGGFGGMVGSDGGSGAEAAMQEGEYDILSSLNWEIDRG